MNAFHQHEKVVLLFSETCSKHIQGFAVVESDPDENLMPGLFKTVQDPNMPHQRPYQFNYKEEDIDPLIPSQDSTHIKFTYNFKVRWVVKCQFPFALIEHLVNEKNDN